MADLFKRGEILTAAKLNAAFSDGDITVAGSGAVSRDAGGHVVRVDTPDYMHIRLTDKITANSVVKYAWKEVYRNANATWANTTHNGTANGDYAVEINNANLPTGGLTVYSASRSPESGEWIFENGSGLLSTDIRGKDIVLMILGTEEEYDTCANAPAASPGCWQGYAWAAYKVCGYTYTKLFDARDMGKWALELNGGTTTAWRRFHPAFWGWDTYTDGLPTTANACEGVRFINVGASALSCSCPSWINDLDCIKLQFTTPARPTNPQECATAVANMDAADAWGKTVNVVLCRDASCSFSGTAYNGLFTVSMSFEEIPRTDPECFWGPESFDPCDPCAAFGRFFICIEINGGNEPNCGSGCHYTGQFRLNDLKSLHDNCLTGNGSLTISPYNSILCNGCGNGQTPPAIYHFINDTSVILKCCNATETASC